MPYRRLPKTDAARLKALEALVDNKEVYAEGGRFVNRQLLAEAQLFYGQLSDNLAIYKMSMRTQVRYTRRIGPLHHRAALFLSHFLQVLFLAVERGEVPERDLALYGMAGKERVVPYLKTVDAVMEWAPKVIEGEKNRLKGGGKPILSPSIGAVMTHFDVLRKMADTQKQYQTRTQKALADITRLRPEVDRVILSIWDLIEAHFRHLPMEERLVECQKFGIIYYYRRNERRNRG